MNWKWAVTSPPHTMPISPPEAAVCSRKSWTAERFSLSRAMAISSLRRSTAPPPMVPVSRPLAPTSIWEPLFRGALPAVSISVTSTVSRCFSIS